MAGLHPWWRQGRTGRAAACGGKAEPCSQHRCDRLCVDVWVAVAGHHVGPDLVELGGVSR